MRFYRSFITILPFILHSTLIGSSYADQRDRTLIIGGTPTAGQEFPFYVQSPDSRCGGALVAPDVFLTVNSCFDSFNGNKVLVGPTKPNNTVVGPAQWRDIVGNPVHQADGPWFGDGIALYKIEPVNLPNLKAVVLNSDESIPAPGQSLTVLGFGADNRTDDYYYYPPYSYPNVLLKATVKAQDNAVCSALYWEFFNETTILCALGDSETGSGPFYGDVGGPLVDSSKALVGLVNLESDFCRPYTPSTYFRVSGSIGWIQNTICKLTDNVAALTFACPDLTCPLDSTIFGYPTATLPRAAKNVRAFNGFTIASISQNPAAGTELSLGSTTTVKVTATDSSNNKKTCDWTVIVPPLSEVAWVSVDLQARTGQKARKVRKGQANQKVQVPFNPNWDSGRVTISPIHQMSGIAFTFKDDGSEDSNASISMNGTLKRGTKSFSPSLFLSTSFIDETVTFPAGIPYAQDFELAFMAKRLRGWGYVDFYLLAQVMFN